MLVKDLLYFCCDFRVRCCHAAVGYDLLILIHDDYIFQGFMVINILS